MNELNIKPVDALVKQTLDRAGNSFREDYERRLRELSEPPYGTKVTISQEPLDYWQTPNK